MPFKDKTKKKLYDVWTKMKSRCYDLKAPSYKNYGARGISICYEWKEDFYKFYNWSLDNGYSDDLTIDRIDVNGNYCPENCRWVNMKIQQNNKRNNHLITYNNQTKTMQEWADNFNLNITTISERIKSGCDLEHLFLSIEDYKEYKKITMQENGKYITYNNETHTITDWAKKYGMTRGCLKQRLNRDKSPIDKALLPTKEYKKYRQSLKGGI